VKPYFTSSYWKGQRLLLLVFLLLHIAVSSVYITWQHITFDEKDYYGYSVKWLHGDVDRDNKIYDSKTPVVAVAAIPRMIKQVLQPGYKATDSGLSDLRKGRYFMVVFTLIIALYLFRWIRRLFGSKAWIIPLLLFLFDPMVLGFSMIITSDMASGACLLAAAWHLYAFYEKRSWRQLLSFATWLAVGFICKASLLYFVPYLVLLVIVLIVAGKLRVHLKNFLAYSFVTGFIILVIMNLAYFGKGTFRPLKQSKFQSSAFQSLSSTPVIKDIPLPLPYSYVQGLDMLQYHGEIGAGHPESTHHGSFVGNKAKDRGGFWYYYLYTGFYKIPIPTLLLLVAGFFIVIFGPAKHFFHKHIWYLLPFSFFFIVLSCFNPFQNGFRHFLLIYPFCFLFIAAAVSFIGKHFSYGRFVTAAMGLYMIVSSAIYFPWLIAYTNEFITDKKTVFRKIKDSSIDYGQNVQQLGKFRIKHPGYSLAIPGPKPGKYIVPAYQLINYTHRENASWLGNFEPSAHYQYSMFLFNISEADISALKKKGRQ
jgi:hypothetical protein